MGGEGPQPPANINGEQAKGVSIFIPIDII